MSLASNAPTASNTNWEDMLRAGDVKPVPRSPGLALRIATDLASLSLAFAVTLKLRLWLGSSLFSQLDAETLYRITPPVWLILALWLISAWWARLYRPRKGFGPFETLIQVVEAMGLATALTVLATVALFENGGSLSRAFLLLQFVVAVICALALRSGLWFATRLMRANGRPENVLIVGEGNDTLALINHLSHAPDSQVAVRGVMTTGGRLREAMSCAPVLGAIGDLRFAINQTRADRVFVVDTELPLEGLAQCIDVCTAMHIPLNCTGGGLTRFPTVVTLIEVAGLRLLEVRREEFERSQDLLKRTTDIALAAVLLVATLPLLIVLAIAIKWNSSGPVLFVSDRVGRGGRHFKFLKFRSMVSGAEVLRANVHAHGGLDGHIFKAANDFRITPVGRFMRRFSLDELPQLLNVIWGDMSLVGPRPLPARDLDPDGLSERYRTWSVERSIVRPGITGLWQVRGRSRLPFEEMVRLDLLYIQTRSFRVDLQILLETLPAVLSGRGAM